ncbi:MAG: tetratricopeptide repeat protein [Bacteroidales bacterium]
MKRNLFFAVLTVVGLGLLIPTVGIGQTMKEAVDAYNSAATTYKQDPKAALDNLNKAIQMCEQLGEEGSEVKVNSESLIPKVYFEMAMLQYKQKDLQGTLDNLEKAEETATKYNDDAVKSRVEKTIPKLYNVMGNNKFKEEKYDEAIVNYTKAINFSPDFVDPYIGATLSYEKLNNEAKMLEYIDKTIEVAQKANDTKTADETSSKAKNFFLLKADEAQKATKYDDAVTSLSSALKYDSTDFNTYRLLAINYNRVEKWDDGIQAALKAIELKTGTVEEKAELYFLLATAYQKVNDTPKACEAYKNAAYGTFKPNADYQIQQLKCQ